MIDKLFMTICFVSFLVAVQARPKDQKEVSKEDDICFLPKMVGICKASFERYYFDKEAGDCRIFEYGGCRGNENNFRSKEDCTEKCGKFVRKTEARGKSDACTQEPFVGPCRAAETRFFYNQTAQKCQVFLFGGCKPNLNNFKTKQDCEAMCVEAPVTTDSESAPSAVVPELTAQEPYQERRSENLQPVLGTEMCVARKRKWTYINFGKYKLFIYGGCGGPKNLSVTKKECQENCEPGNLQPRTPLVGSNSKWKPITEEVKKLVKSFRKQIEAKIRNHFASFEPLEYKKLVVAGKTYLLVKILEKISTHPSQ